MAFWGKESIENPVRKRGINDFKNNYFCGDKACLT